MKNNRLMTKKLFLCFVAAFFLALFSFGVYTLTSRLSLAASSGWDGVTVATEFARGNGTAENPYVIEDGPEFIYFKQILEGDSYETYYNKYYQLGDDIDLGGNTITPIGVSNEEVERIFEGAFDGNGHFITNFKISEPSVIGDTAYYSLFAKTRNASFTSLGITEYELKVGEVENRVVASLLVGSSTVTEEGASTFDNLFFNHFYFDASSLKEGSNAYLLIGEKEEKVSVSNISFNGDIQGNESVTEVAIASTYSNISNIIDGVRIIDSGVEGVSYGEIDSVYHIDGEESAQSAIEVLNGSIADDHYWAYENNEFVLKEYEKVVMEVPETSKSFTFSMQKAPNFSLHASGIDGNTVYINDLDSDYNYYMGRNYTSSSNGDTPTMEDKGIYGSSNLKKFQIIYHGDLDENRVGTISYASGENQNTIVYYKYYYVTGNSIDLELIDNPFAGRPDDMAFNGWFSKDSDVTLYLDPTYYTWHAVVPVSGDNIVVELYASWVEAIVDDTSSNYRSINNALSSLYNAGMHEADVTETRTRPTNTIDNDRYYYVRVILNNGDSQSGYYNERGYSLAGYCNNNTCTVYQRVAAGSPYDPDETYYYSSGNQMRVIDPRGTETYQVVKDIYDGMTMANYYEERELSRNQSQVGYVGEDGEELTGTCTSYYGCTVYEKILYAGESLVDPDKTYYYLVTRDTQFVYLNSSSTTRNNNAWSSTKPFTLTSWYYRNTDARGTGYYSMTIAQMRALQDVRVEFVQMNSYSNGNIDNGSLSSTYNSTGYIYGNRHNFKLGRGITRNGNNRSAVAVTGGANDNYNASNLKYKLIVESGYYGYISPFGLQADGTFTNPDVIAIYGSDYDRVRGINTNLDVVRTIYGSNQPTVNCNPIGAIGLRQYILSGTIGSLTNSTNTTIGIYVTSNGSGRFTCTSQLTVEGGIVNNIYGGPGPSQSAKDDNIVNIFFKGGTADAIFGGGAYLVSYSNRIVQVTGGLINYAVTGGSNGYASDGSSNQRGTLNGDTYTYIGGTAVIGAPNLLNQTPAASKYDMEVGSVFGVGNGKDGYTNIGSSDNSYVVVNGGVIHGSVYGGANFGAVAIANTAGTYESKVKILSGTIDKSVYGGGNNNGAGVSGSTVNTSIEMLGGTVSGSVYGGSKTKGTIYGPASVTISGGTVGTDVYGGGEGGYSNNNNPGTYVRNNVTVTVNNGTINGNVYGGSAYGTVNAVNQNTNSSNNTTTVTVNNGTITGSVFGGAKGSATYTPKVVGNITVNVNGGSIGKVYGGMDAAGQPSGTDYVYLSGGTIGDAFGGGNNTGQSTTNIYLQGSDITGNLYGGSNQSGTVTTSNVTVTSGSVTDIYGGNNLAGSTGTTHVTVTGGTINGDIYGGGNEASATTSHVTINGPTVHDVYGGCKKANLTTTNVTITNSTGGNVFGGSNINGTVGTSHVNITSSQFDKAYGGNNQGGQTNNTNIETTSSTIGYVYGGGDNAASTTSHVTIHSGTIGDVFGGGNEAGLTTANVVVEDGTITNVFGGSNTRGDITTANITVGNNNASNIQIGTLYGGNNLGGVTTTANITATKGTITTIYGGGNEAGVGTTVLHLSNTNSTDIYGGGNAAGVSGSTLLDLDDVIVENNIYGGGNEGVVEGNTVVTVTDSHIKGNAFAGGNGSTAIVYQNSTITIDGDSEIGTSTSEAPNEGCVFGSGNAASTGLESIHNSKATVNIVGGEVHGNVYGGPKMAVVYGTTDTNIGTAAVNQTGLTEDDIIIHGTVFGGGESNASGSDTYDWTFISVTDGIDVNIDGTGYEGHSHQFILNGSIFGSGNASSSAGTSNVHIKNLGTVAHPNVSVSIQRANNVVIENSVIELLGAKDRTNEFADILYSFNIIDKLTIKNGTTLLLQHNANLLKELYSGVDSGGNLVPATVTINENTGTVTKNVDNRIYMIPGQNLNVTINQAATAYGEITGMTFFGMYNSYGNGSYRFGLYDRSYNHGDSANASLAIPGGSYVVGLRKTNHDITKDGFYTNTLDEHFTEIITNYIDPTRIGETGYRWVVGFESINYEFTLIASKYSSLGTYELSMIHFAEGNTKFTVLGFDPQGLNDGLSLVDSNVVPRMGANETEANSVFGLSMKAETQEWTGYGTTKLLTQEVSDGKHYTGTEDYLTDNRSIAPSMMFYLYHAKNITSQGPLGTVVVTMQAAIPKNQIDDDIKFITITIHLTSVNADADSYDASITYDKKYEMPSSTSVNITNQSQFSTYFSLTTFKDQFSKVYGADNDYFHVLVTNYPLPVNSMITMIDYGANDQIPNYYYFKVTQSVYNDSLTQLNTYNEVTYRLSNFIKMDSTSTNNTYDDATNNLLYYDSTSHLVDEEFMFIFDFKECNVSGNHLDNTMLFELRNDEDRTMFSVLGAREGLMVYSTYESSNAVLSQTLNDVDSYLYYNVSDEIDYSTEILYDETENRQSVIDTNYESRGMGLNVIFTDRDGEQVSSSLLLGTSVSVGNQQYFADGDGVFRIKLSNKVSNLHKTLKVTPNVDLPAGQYTVRYVLFASDDGLHNSDASNSVYQDFVVQVVSADNSITVDCEDEVKVVNGDTGLNMLGTRINTYHVKYASELTNPNFRVEVYKRGITTIDATDYSSVPFSQLFTNSLSTVSGNEVSISMDNLDEKDFEFQLQTNLTSGTYRIVFKLYDSNQLIDEETKYVIVNKNVE